jgi:amidohydrolase
MHTRFHENTIGQLVRLRKQLHQHAEPSGSEVQTAKLLTEYLEGLNPHTINNGIGGNGVAAVFDSKIEGPCVLFRADMDALPIEEENDFEYRSLSPGVSHKCGHDGHMTILLGFGQWLSHNPPKKGKVILVFQPEEETGQGAEKVLQDAFFNDHKPDFVFALHNLPGYEKNAVILRQGPFAAASKGMIISLKGRSSHAAHPEQGNSPVKMMTKLIEQLLELPLQKDIYQDFALLTIIHARLGEPAFGTNPGRAQVMATLRTYLDKDIEILTNKACQLAESLSGEFELEHKISFTEVFPATINHPDAFALVKEAAVNARLQLIKVEEPFRWSEDFGHFTSRYKGVLFGIGAGKNHPGLHNPDYDFPDEIISSGITMFINIYQQLQTTH